MKKIQLIPIALFTVLTACQSPSDHSSEADDGRLKIVCTTGMIGDAVENLVKDQAHVFTLMGPGVDPHLYKATQGDLEKLSNADIIIYNGLHLEGKMGEVFEKLENRKKILVAANGVEKAEFIKNGDFQGDYDPHLWFDPILWSLVVENLGMELSRIEELNKNLVIANTERYSSSIRDLDEWIRAEIEKIPVERRMLITAHDAFGYFGRRYNIEVEGLQGISTLSEYGLKDVSDLVDFIIENQIPSIYIESSISDRALKAVVEGCNEKGFEVQIGGTLYSDAMGEEGTEEATYVGMVQANVNTIVNGLK